MQITPELIAVAILGVSMVSLGWKVSSDIRRELKQELKQEIHHVREDVAALGSRIGGLEHRIGGLEQRIGGLEQRMARLEGWMEGRFAEELVLKPNPAQ